MSTTDIAAWWGAVVASLVLVWDVYKWRNRGAALKVTAGANFKAINVPGLTSDLRFVSVTVVNNGNLPATIRSLAGRHYKTVFHKLLRRENGNFLVVNPGFGPGLPAVLEPGGEWVGGISQEDLVEKVGRGDALYCGVCVSTQQQPILVRVRLPEQPSNMPLNADVE